MPLIFVSTKKKKNSSAIHVVVIDALGWKEPGITELG